MNVFDLLQAVQADLTQLQTDLNTLQAALQGANLAAFLSTLQAVDTSLQQTIAVTPANGQASKPGP